LEILAKKTLAGLIPTQKKRLNRLKNILLLILKLRLKKNSLAGRKILDKWGKDLTEVVSDFLLESLEEVFNGKELNWQADGGDVELVEVTDE